MNIRQKSEHNNPTWDEIKKEISDCININNNGCWIWKRPLNINGYGRIWGDMAHRMAYQAYIGPIGKGLDIDHLCRNRACVNPNHLEPVTRKINLERGIGVELQKKKAREKTHCSEGHELTEENTYIRPSDGSRICRKCRALKERNWFLSNKDAKNAYRREWRNQWKLKGVRK